MAANSAFGINSITGRPQTAFLFQELNPGLSKQFIGGASGVGLDSADLVAFGLDQKAKKPSDLFVFQYWPTQIQDNYEVEWASKIVPGGSLPLYQWIGGSGRTITFDALFTAEVQDNVATIDSLIPSARYTVDVAGAIAGLRRLQYPTYSNVGSKGLATSPPRLRLVFPNTSIGATTDGILCFLKSARVVYESHFPDGTPRVATVSLEFMETAQNVSADTSASNIVFIDSSSFDQTASNYTFAQP